MSTSTYKSGDRVVVKGTGTGETVIVQTNGSAGWLKRNIATIIGWSVQLVILGVFIGRQQVTIWHQAELIGLAEGRITKLEERMTQHHEDVNMHVSTEWRALVLRQLDALDQKLDSHQRDTMMYMERGRR